MLVFDTIIDSHYFSHLEAKLDKVQFKRVDADVLDNLIEKDEKQESVLSKRDEEKLSALFNEQINNPGVTVILKAMSPDDQPALIIKPEFSRRMKDMAAAGGMADTSMIPDQMNLIINANHPLTGRILSEKSKKKKEAIVTQLYDLALLSQNMLKGSKLTDFVKRSVSLIE